MARTATTVTLMKNLDLLLNRDNMTYADLSKKLGISPSTISMWKKESNPRIDVIEKIAKIFEISTIELLGQDFKSQELSIESALHSIKSTASFFEYMLGLGYKISENPYNDKWSIQIEDVNAEIFVSAEELNSLENITKENIELRMSKYLHDDKHNS